MNNNNAIFFLPERMNAEKLRGRMERLIWQYVKDN